jgi:hypothetical protein
MEMNKLILFIFSIIIIKHITSFEIENIYNSFINPNICNSPLPSDINCYYEINIWYYVPSNINKIYFFIPLEQELSEVNFYKGNINELPNIILIEKSSELIYELLRGKDKLFIIFTKKQNGNKNILINHYYSNIIN